MPRKMKLQEPPLIGVKATDAYGVCDKFCNIPTEILSISVCVIGAISS